QRRYREAEREGQRRVATLSRYVPNSIRNRSSIGHRDIHPSPYFNDVLTCVREETLPRDTLGGGMPRWINLANLFTLLRLALVPFIVSDIIHGLHVRALTLFFIAALTDVIDGALARSASGITQAGAYFDPIADKCLMSGVFLALWAAAIVPGWFVGI